MQETRRRVLRLTLGASALLAALQATGAAADDEDDEPDNHDQHEEAPPPRHRAGAQLQPFSSDLITVGQSASSGDFTSGNAGSDPLSNGRIGMVRNAGSSNEGRAAIVLRGAAASVSYDVFFQPFNTGKGREGLGTVGPTNQNGDLNMQTPNALSGVSRVGVFILARTGDGSGQAGKDEFVSSMGG